MSKEGKTFIFFFFKKQNSNLLIKNIYDKP